MTYRAQQSIPILVVAFGGRIFGVDPASGRHIWGHESREPSQLHIVRLHVVGDRVYAVIDRELRVLSYTTGQVLSSVSIPHGATSTMMLLEGRIYCAGNGAVACFGLDGALLWADEFSGMGYGDVAFAVPGYAVQADRDS